MDIFRQSFYPIALLSALLLSIAANIANADSPPVPIDVPPVNCQRETSTYPGHATTIDSSLSITATDQSLVVSNRAHVQQQAILWQIDGSALEDPPHGAFRDLALPLSSPQRAVIRWCTEYCVARDVLLFGGGYDPVFDNSQQRPSHSRGNAIYMVDAATGELLWSAGGNNYHDLTLDAMRHSMVADISVVDSDGDCFADTVFAIDIAGNLFRFDFVDTELGDQAFAAGGRIADIGGGKQSLRRFFNPPDIALFTPREGEPFFTIAVASGNRRDTLATHVENYLFVLFDNNVLQPPADYSYTLDDSIITPADLFLAGENSSSSLGWYLPLQANGEKALDATVTFNHRVFLNTLIPNGDFRFRHNTLTGRAYFLDALTGTSYLQQNSHGEWIVSRELPAASQSAPWYQIETLSPGDGPQLLVTTKPDCSSHCGEALNPLAGEYTTITACVGNHCLPTDIDPAMHRIYWRSEP